MDNRVKRSKWIVKSGEIIYQRYQAAKQRVIEGNPFRYVTDRS